MFTFGFSRDEGDVKDVKVPKECKVLEVKISRELKFEEFRNVEHNLEKENISYRNFNKNVKVIDSMDDVLQLIDIQDTETSTIIKAEQMHSDLLPGIYEGGCTIWEATDDAINYIENEELQFSNKKVLDLGCGAGLIGITCMMKGATCYFQDYNDEVLKYVTFPNIKMNMENIPLYPDRCKFFCGDWSLFSELWQKEYSQEDKFDYIFTSETIYNLQNYPKLHDVFCHMLSPGGVIYLAAKAYYFGVGGGLYDFRKMLDEKNTFTYKTVWKFTDGVRREILEIRFK